MATDGEAIYWSFASTLVKTDLNGNVLKSVPVPYHCGDPCWTDGALYVPYGGGSWNREIGDAESRNFIRVYNAELELTGEHHVPEVVYGAGCIEFRNGKFYVGGGLPDGKGENYIYEYDAKFRFVKRHVIPVASHLGVQTIKYAAGSFWLGCYGKPNFCIRTDEQFRIRERYDYATTVGVIPAGRHGRPGETAGGLAYFRSAGEGEPGQGGRAGSGGRSVPEKMTERRSRRRQSLVLSRSCEIASTVSRKRTEGRGPKQSVSSCVPSMRKNMSSAPSNISIRLSP